MADEPSRESDEYGDRLRSLTAATPTHRRVQTDAADRLDSLGLRVAESLAPRIREAVSEAAAELAPSRLAALEKVAEAAAEAVECRRLLMDAPRLLSPERSVRAHANLVAALAALSGSPTEDPQR